MSDLVRLRLFDCRLEHLSVRLAHEGDRATFAPRTGRTTHSVYILRQLARHVVVDHRRDSLDVETSRGQVRSEKVVDLAQLEVVQRVQTLPSVVHS